MKCLVREFLPDYFVESRQTAKKIVVKYSELLQFASST